jgi:integrase/recombinase XerD
MHLIKATEEYKIGTSSMPGFPIILWENMQSCLEVNQFLRSYLVRGQIGSSKSWEPIARAMYDYFGFLEAHELSWTEVKKNDEKNLVESYRDYCLNTIKLARNTVRLRILYVCEFYKYAEEMNWISNLPYKYEKRNYRAPDVFHRYSNVSDGEIMVRDVMPKKHKELIKFLSQEQVKILLEAAHNPHHRTIIRMALQTGLRREELATFPVAYIFDPNQRGITKRNVCITLDPQDGTGIKTKGSKKRNIYISTRLMRDLHQYVVHWRGQRATISKSDQAFLFLNQSGQPWAGDGKGLERMISKMGAKVGVKTYPHMLRHTYATHTLVALQRQRGETRIEPVVFLQKQLGHASLHTTLEYLHLINELADDAVLAYDDELNYWMDSQSQ